MGLVVGFMVFMFIAFLFAMNSGANRGSQSSWGGGGSFGGGAMDLWSLRSNGTPARGILLSISSTGRRQNFRGQRFEIRNGRVDIEIAGTLPYEINADVYIPSNLVRDVLPGSTVELRIDPGDRSMVLVIGPDVGYAQGAVRTT